MKAAKKAAPKPSKGASAPAKPRKGFTDEERAAMRERLQEAEMDAGRGRHAHKAKLDDGNMWPTAFALHALREADEARIAALVRQAVG